MGGGGGGGNAHTHTLMAQFSDDRCVRVVSEDSFTSFSILFCGFSRPMLMCAIMEREYVACQYKLTDWKRLLVSHTGPTVVYQYNQV